MAPSASWRQTVWVGSAVLSPAGVTVKVALVLAEVKLRVLGVMVMPAKEVLVQALPLSVVKAATLREKFCSTLGVVTVKLPEVAPSATEAGPPVKPMSTASLSRMSRVWVVRPSCQPVGRLEVRVKVICS